MKRHKWNEVNNTTDKCKKCGIVHKWVQLSSTGIGSYGRTETAWIFINEETGERFRKNPGCNS